MKKPIAVMSMALSLALSINSPFACDMHGTTGFLPKNSLRIPVGLKNGGGISEAQFHRVIDRVTKIYAPELKKMGANLVVEKNWANTEVNAYAMQDGNNWIVSMFGGLARHRTITEDGFTIVMCHELGHHIGGAPKKIDTWSKMPRWASSEGQSDYFANLKCLRRVFENDQNEMIVKNLKVPTTVTEKCQNIYKNSNEIAICIRGAMAGLSVGKLFQELGGEKEIQFHTPDPSVVAVNYDAHPDAQCRLDTYFQGSLCDKSVSDEVSNQSQHDGTCTQKNGDRIGLRPACWFKETN